MSYYYTQVFKRYQPRLLELTGSVTEIDKSFKKSNLLICGESHGVRENADIAYTLCKTFKIKQLAIERSASKFEPFIQSAVNGKPNFLLPQVLVSLQASMLSLEMLKTIVMLIKEGSIEAIEYIDIDSESSSDLKNLDSGKYMQIREQEIAKNITALNASIPAMAILGNYHTRQDIDEVVGKSALQIVRQERSATYLQYKYLSGHQYNSGRLLKFDQSSSDRNNKLPKGYSIEKNSEDNFTIEIPKAHRILV